MLAIGSRLRRARRLSRTLGLAATGASAVLGLVALGSVACVPAARTDSPSAAVSPGSSPGTLSGVQAAPGLKPAGLPQSGLGTVELRSGRVAVTAELAIAPEEQETGLMHRTRLADGQGMLFVYESDRRMAFWMKDTLIPLSIAYIGADGVIKEIYDMEPLSLASVPSERSVRYALEVPLGWFGRVGLGPGDRLDIPEALAGR